MSYHGLRGGLDEDITYASEDVAQATYDRLDEQNKARQKRRKQPGRQPPDRNIRNRSEGQQADDGHEGGSCSQPGDGDEGGSSSHQQGNYQATVEKRHAAWQDQLLENKARLQGYVALRSGIDRKEALQERQAALQRRVVTAINTHAHRVFGPALALPLQHDGGPSEDQQQQNLEHGEPPVGQEWQQHEADDSEQQAVQEGQEQTGQPNMGTVEGSERQQQQQQQQQQQFDWGLDGTCCRVVSLRRVTCLTCYGRVELVVPKVKCDFCPKEWEVHALDCGCFPSAPEDVTYWVETAVLDAYTPLAAGGTSMASLAASLGWQQQQHWWASDASEPPAAVDERILRHAWQQYQRVMKHALDLEGLEPDIAEGMGPARDCPACTHVPPTETATGTRGNTDAAAPGQFPGASLAASTPVARATAVPPQEHVAELGTQPVEDAGHPSFVALTESGLVSLYRADGRRQIFAVASDSNLKVNRYKHAGRAQVHLSPGPTDYFGEAHRCVWATSPGPVPGSHADLQGGPAGSHAADLQLEAEVTMHTHCHPRLSCAREQSSALSVLDEHGLTGLVCSHGQPLRGGFLAMNKPERFEYYDRLVVELLGKADVNLFYLDTGCTYRRHWDKTFPADPRRPTHFKVPWWHAQAHGSNCFTVNSGMYLSGGGRRIGENCEQVWSELKPIAAMARYMTKVNYLHFVDDALSWIATQRLNNFHDFMANARSAASKKLDEAKKAVQEVEQRATAAAITIEQLLQAAVQSFPAQDAVELVGEETSQQARERLLVQYVRNDREQQALELLDKQGGAFAVALPGAEGRALRAKAMDAARSTKLRRQQAQLLEKLHFGELLSRDDPVYKTALARHAELEVVRLQDEVEKEVSSLSALKTERSAAGAASKETKSLDKRIKRRHKSVHQLLAALSAWRRDEGARSSPLVQRLPRAWSDELVGDVCDGAFPWQDDNSINPALSHLGAQYRDAKAELARSLEEVHLLRLESGRAQRFHQYVLQALEVKAAVAEAAAKTTAAAAEATTAESAVAAAAAAAAATAATATATAPGVEDAAVLAARAQVQALLLQGLVKKHKHLVALHRAAAQRTPL